MSSMLVRWFAALLFAVFAFGARADQLDDTLAKFQQDKFSETAKAVSELAASGASNASAILDALGDGRLLVDTANHLLVYKTTSGDIVNARTNAKLSGVDASAFKTVRVNNGLRSAIDAALGSLTLANPDPAKRVAAADAVFKSRDAKALPAIEAALAKETDPTAKNALLQARAAILVGDNAAPVADRLAAIAALKTRADQDAESLLGETIDSATAPEVKAAAQSALTSVKTTLQL